MTFFRSMGGPLRAAAVSFVSCMASLAHADGRMCTSADTLLFGNRAVGSSTTLHAIVTNCGDAPFSFTDVSPHAANGPAWQLATTCATGQALAPAAACAVDVTFAPTATGQTSGGLWLHNTTTTPDQLITFYGRGVDAQAGTAIVSFAPNPVTFGAIRVLQQAGPVSVLVSNVGAATLVPSALVINGPAPYDYSAVSTGDPQDCAVGVAVAPGQACRMNFYFRPQAAGLRQAELVIDAPQLATLAILPLTGTGTQDAPTIDVVEFHNASDGQYFITAEPAEIAYIDGGGLGASWTRTGMQFKAWARDETSVADALPVCRFFGTPGIGPNSHFYTAFADECAKVRADPHWQDEGTAFRARTPAADGTCPAGSTTIQRLWWAGGDATASRHRYVSDASLVPPMQAAGWVLEGPVFCAPP